MRLRGKHPKERNGKPSAMPPQIHGHVGELGYENGKIEIKIDGLRIDYCAGYSIDHAQNGQPILTVRVLLKTLNRDARIVVPAGPVGL